MAKNQFWGEVFKYTGAVVSMPVGLVNGGIKLVRGESFSDGLFDVVESTAEKCQKFGEEHGDRITRTAVTGVTIAVSAAAGKDAYSAVKNNAKKF